VTPSLRINSEHDNPECNIWLQVVQEEIGLVNRRHIVPRHSGTRRVQLQEKVLRKTAVESRQAYHLHRTARLVRQRAVSHGERLACDKFHFELSQANTGAERPTGGDDLEHARIDLVADGVDGPAGQRAVVQFGDRSVSQHAQGPVAGFGESLGGYVEGFPRVVEFPPVALRRRVRLDLAHDVHTFASGGSHHHDLLVLASGGV
jgi:hypothetical protein